MKKLILLACVGLGFSLASCTSNDKEIASATLSSTVTSENIGSAKFYSIGNGKIKMDLELNMIDKSDSTIAVHFHEHGDCGNMGENTHGHWNPTNEPHGKWDSESHHSGDIGNVTLDGKGRATITVTTDRWSTIDGDMKNIIGRGIIVHDGTDDYTTQPTGNSGSRIGCGVIEGVK